MSDKTSVAPTADDLRAVVQRLMNTLATGEGNERAITAQAEKLTRRIAVMEAQANA